jgi:ubiquinone/menaquinone biosynthesis C-methylase UbiE
MEQKEFQNMWQRMQKEGYFSNHPHYTDHFGADLSDDDKQLDAMLLSLDFSGDDIIMPVPYSEALERSVKRTESQWLYRMFKLPLTGTAFDLGCGFGRSVQWLSKRYQHVYASDISAEVIASARQRIAADNVSFCVNDADSIPSEIPGHSVDVAYIFTVFQHIPREYSLQLLSQVAGVLNDDGVAVFNLLSNVNLELNHGDIDTEWAIGYSRQQAGELVASAGLKLQRLVRWSRPETEISWLWVQAGK